MLIQNITQYQSFAGKSKKVIENPAGKTVSKSDKVDTYESSETSVHTRPSSSEVRKDLIKTVKKRIGSGFYDSKDVLEDLSSSFAKALQQTIL